MVKLKTQLASLRTQLKEKDQRIKQLEDQISIQTQNVATQVKLVNNTKGLSTIFLNQPFQTTRNLLPAQTMVMIPPIGPTVHRPHSLHNLPYITTQGFKPCHHVWGPCANDHIHHHSRTGLDTAQRQGRSSNTGRTPGRSSSPWEHSSSGSSGSSPIARKLKHNKVKIMRESRDKRLMT